MFRAIGLGPGQVRPNRTKEYDTMIRDSFSTALGFELPTDGWMVSEDAYEPDRNLQYESLFALSNGYLGIRGSHEEGNKPTLPYLYVNGVFDKSETFMKELATLPNWLGKAAHRCRRMRDPRIPSCT